MFLHYSQVVRSGMNLLNFYTNIYFYYVWIEDLGRGNEILMGLEARLISEWKFRKCFQAYNKMTLYAEPWERNCNFPGAVRENWNSNCAISKWLYYRNSYMSFIGREGRKLDQLRILSPPPSPPPIWMNNEPEAPECGREGPRIIFFSPMITLHLG
jgi:hypothetical protein